MQNSSNDMNIKELMQTFWPRRQASDVVPCHAQRMPAGTACNRHACPAMALDLDEHEQACMPSSCAVMDVPKTPSQHDHKTPGFSLPVSTNVNPSYSLQCTSARTIRDMTPLHVLPPGAPHGCPQWHSTMISAAAIPCLVTPGPASISKTQQI